MNFGPFDRYQASAPATVPLVDEDFLDRGDTAVHWLSASGVLVNSHGTTLLVDPLLTVVSDDPAVGETGEPLMTAPPILAHQVKRVDAVLYTHTDNDHLGSRTAQTLMKLGVPFHGPSLVVDELIRLGLPVDRGFRHGPGERFSVGNLEVLLTPAFHPHQLLSKDFTRYFGPRDCCGYRLETPDGTVWIPGDSLLMNEHLEQRGVDLLFADFSANASHFGLDFSIGLANVHETARLIMYHFATFYGPDNDWCNADPAVVRPRLRHPERLLVLAPGARHVLQKVEAYAPPEGRLRLYIEGMWPDFPKPPPEPRPDPAIYQALGTEGVKQLIRAFYREIAVSPIAHLFPQDLDALDASADNSALFWVTMVGGPPLYEEKHGKPMIRQRHLRFTLRGSDRAHWLACWEPVLAVAPERFGFPAEHIEGFRKWVNTFSAWIVNTEESP